MMQVFYPEFLLLTNILLLNNKKYLYNDTYNWNRNINNFVFIVSTI